MQRLRKSRYRSSGKSGGACSKEESAKSKVRGNLDDLPPVEVVFPFLNFQPKFDLFTHKNVKHGSWRPSQLEKSSFLAEDSFEIPEVCFSFPIYSQHEWIWLGEDGYDAPPLEPICGAFLSNREYCYDGPPLEPICGSLLSNREDCYGLPPLEPIRGVLPSNPIDPVQKPDFFSSHIYSEKEIERRDYYKKKVRFADQESKQTKRKSEPEYYNNMYGNSRKKANIPRESALERGSPVSTQHHTPIDLSFAIRDNFAQKCVRSKDSVHTKTLPYEEPNNNTSVECIKFNNVADILAIASAVSKKESKSTASNDDNTDQVTTRSSSRSGQVRQALSTKVQKNSSTFSESPNADIRQEDSMMKSLVITPKSSENIDSDDTEIYFPVSRSSNEGKRQKDSSGARSKTKSGVVEEKEDRDVTPRRSTRIHLRQSRGKRNNLFEPLWTETEWWVKS